LFVVTVRHTVRALTMSVTAIAVTASLVGCGLVGSSKGKPKLRGEIAFGVLAPLSGDLAERGKDLADGAALAAAELNDAGGVLGRRLVLKVVDETCTAAAGKVAAVQMVSEDVVAVVGGVCEDSTAAAVDTLAQTQIPFLIAAANRDDLVSAEQPAFLLNGTPYMQALSAVHWMAYNSAQRVAIVDDESAGSQLLTKHAIQALDVAPEVASRQTVPAGSLDMQQTAKVALVSEPDFVYWTGSAAAGGALLKALREAGFDGIFTASGQSEDPTFLETAGAAADGAYVVATAGPHNVPGAKEWVEKFTTQYQHEPGFDALQGYDGVRALAQAVVQTGDTAGTGIVAQLQRLDDSFTTFLGPLRFAPDHTMTYDNRVILVVRSGAFSLERTLRTDN
jgi:branched-chain amino acid transport system substrate-binding protein